MFAVVRHPDIDALGIVPQAAFDMHQAKGFYRVSEWRENPGDFHLPDYADGIDLDATVEFEPEPEAQAKKPAKKTVEDEESSE